MRLSRITTRLHRVPDEPQDTGSILSLVLALRERIVDAVPLRDLAGIDHTAGRDQHGDFLPLEAILSVTQCA